MFAHVSIICVSLSVSRLRRWLSRLGVYKRARQFRMVRFEVMLTILLKGQIWHISDPVTPVSRQDAPSRSFAYRNMIKIELLHFGAVF